MKFAEFSPELMNSLDSERQRAYVSGANAVWAMVGCSEDGPNKAVIDDETSFYVIRPKLAPPEKTAVGWAVKVWSSSRDMGYAFPYRTPLVPLQVESARYIYKDRDEAYKVRCKAIVDGYTAKIVRVVRR